MRPRIAPILLLGITLLATARVAGAESFDELQKKVQEALKGTEPEARLSALASLGASKDPRAIDVLVTFVGGAAGRRSAVEKSKTDTQTALEKVLAEIERSNEAGASTPKEITAFNKKMRRLQSERESIASEQRKLGTAGLQVSAEIEMALGALGALLKSLPEAEGNAAVERLAGVWYTKAAPEDRDRYLTVLGIAGTVPAARERLKAVSMDAEQHPLLRAIAIRGRGQPGDVDALPDLSSLLDAPLDHGRWTVVEAAIDTLRRMHKQGAIEPLIRFLGRKETGKLKRSAWKALKSLTGQAHGPFEEPWATWWKEAQAKFFMPPRPVDTVALEAPDPNSTYFGEPLWSNRVVFVFDISKSMLDLAHPGGTGARAKETRMDVLRREFGGLIDQLGEVGLFDIVLFASGVVVFSPEGVIPDAPSKARARKFLEEAQPNGGTNIHDALETAFRLALPKAGAEKAPYDTIVFLTDGTPTSGKLVDTDQILAAVSRWNAAGVLSLRVVGIGECDEAFLKKLAEQNKGTFVKR